MKISLQSFKRKSSIFQQPKLVRFTITLVSIDYIYTDFPNTRVSLANFLNQKLQLSKIIKYQILENFLKMKIMQIIMKILMDVKRISY